MTTNQTIDGVPRELIEKAMLACFEAGFGIPHSELRALLDAERCTSCDGSGDLIDLTGEWHGYCACPAGVALNNKPASQPKPDPVLCKFYDVSDWSGLVRELVGHVAQLQDSAKRNVKPWEDTFPPTLLPAYIERLNAANAAAQPQGEPVAWKVEVDGMTLHHRQPMNNPRAKNTPLYEQPAPFQQRVQPWLLECFGEAIANDGQERNHRFLEEALELVQACGCTATEAHQLVEYVYGRPVGEPSQEVGGVMVTLAALCLAHGIDMHAAGETELARIWTKVDKIRAKQAAKPAMSPLPGAYPDREQPAPVAVVMPDPLQDPGIIAGLSSRYAQGWNACLDEVTRLNTK